MHPKSHAYAQIYDILCVKIVSGKEVHFKYPDDAKK